MSTLNVVLSWGAVGLAVGCVGLMFGEPRTARAVDLDFTAGIVRAMLGGHFVGPMVGICFGDKFDVGAISLLAPLLGAVMLVACALFVRRGVDL